MRPARPSPLLAATASVLPAQRPTPVWGSARAPGVDPAFLKVPSWRFVGPDGNRVIAVAGVPGEYRTYYAGAASGGVLKSTNGGIRWTPVADAGQHWARMGLENTGRFGRVLVHPTNADIV